MKFITGTILLFSILGLLDYVFGCKFGIGKEFEKGFSLFAPMALSMLGMIVIAPAIGEWLSFVFDGFYKIFRIDPSIIPASLFANDMGGLQLSQSVCKSQSIGNYNAFIISSMMGCVISFTIPFSLGVVKKEQHKDMFFGLLCGIATIPLGGIAAGIMCSIKLSSLLINLIPLILLSALLSAMLILIPNVCIKIFMVFGYVIKIVAAIGLAVSVFTFLTKTEISPYFDSFENAAFVCVNACVTLSGALPFMFTVSRLLKKPLDFLGSKMGINGVSALAILGSLVTNASTFGAMDNMDKKGVVINSAFAVSASFALGDHLAYTMAIDGSYVIPMITGKIISGICAVILALVLYKKADSTANV